MFRNFKTTVNGNWFESLKLRIKVKVHGTVLYNIYQILSFIKGYYILSCK